MVDVVNKEMQMYEFEVLTTPKTESFTSETHLWLLAERNSVLSIIRRSCENTRRRSFAIPDSIFANNEYTVGNSYTVSKFYITASKVDTDNLRINFDKEKEVTVDFSVKSLIEILQDKKLVMELKSQKMEERINKVSELLKLKAEEQKQYANQLNEDLKIFFDLQKVGELQDISHWNENVSLVNNEIVPLAKDLQLIETKFREMINARESLSLSEIFKRQKDVGER